MQAKAAQSRIEAIGRGLLDAAARHRQADAAGRWLQESMQRLGGDAHLRVQALRFVDVLPVLADDHELASHLHDYFGAESLPDALGWLIGHAEAGPAPHLLAPLARQAVGWIGKRFIAGEDAEAALEVVRRLREHGREVSLDLLGEAVLGEDGAESYRKRYLALIERLADETGGPPQLSIKLSSLFAQLNPLAPEWSSAAIRDHLRPVVRAVRTAGGGLTLDMEQYDLQGLTLRVFRDLFSEPEFSDWPHASIALQAYLKQSEADLAGLIGFAEQRGTPFGIRLVRGAYWDMERIIAGRQGWESPVWAEKGQTDAAYERCLQLLLTHAGRVRPLIATHNVRSLAVAMTLAEELGLEPAAYEFQMLYGMAEGLQQAVVEAGHGLRVYAPVGPIVPGMAYLVRRLLENSANSSFLYLAFAEQRSAVELLAPPVIPSSGEPLPPPRFTNEPLHRFTEAEERDAFRQALRQVRGLLGQYYPLLIDGQPVEEEACIESRNPARPEELIGTTAAATEDALERAVAAARAGFPAWAARSFAERAALVRNAAGLLRERRDEFAAWQLLEAGKPWREADADVCEAIDHLDYHADRALLLDAGHDFDVAGETNRYRYRPLGVAAVIPPWNFPLAILSGMLGAALVAGNTVIVKPSSQTPVIAARLVSLLIEAGIPAGAVQFLPGEGSRIGDLLVAHPEVQSIAFTGSMEIGCRINRLAAEASSSGPHMKRVIAEMGGKNAVIVDSDADLDDAVAGIVASAFGYAGQKCSACSRVIAVGAIHDRLVERLVDAAASLVIGEPEAPQTLVGPVISAAAKTRILAAIEAGEQSGKLALKVNADRLDGHYVGPAVFTDVDPESALAQEEIFGPVLAVIRAGSFEEALKLANHSCYALTGGVYSRHPAHLEQAARDFDVGNLYLNRNITGAIVARQPFGGFRMSGSGFKAGGPDYLLQFVEAKTVTENTLRRGFAPEAND